MYIIKKNVISFVSLLLIVVSSIVYSQDDYYNMILNLQDTCIVDFESKSNNYAPYGGSFTPKGTFKVLIIYAGFFQNLPTNDPDNQDLVPIWIPDDGTGSHLTVPDYAQSGTPTDLFFSNVSQLDDPQYTGLRNLTRYYYDMSMGQFIFLGDVFKDPDPASATYGQPIRINIDPTGATGWTTCNWRVLDKIKTLYSSYWNSIWAPYDNRTNNPSYQYDYSTSSPDNKVDYVIIHWRYGFGWTNQPTPSTASWSGSQGGLAGLTSYSYGIYTINSGYTVTAGGINAQGAVEFFPHEIAHTLYSCPHLMGANSTLGNFYYKPDAGWGMMSAACHSILCANAWERWLLGWLELESNGEPSDIQDASYLNATGEYILRDFILTGDVIRIKIPNTTSTYLWIENHTKTHLFDYKSWAGLAPTPVSDYAQIPDMEKGVYMFIENTFPTRENFSLSASDMTKVNTIKPINAQGNYDYTRSDWPLEISPGIINPNYYWNNIVYTFQKGNENPISGTNPWFRIMDDYPKYQKNLLGQVVFVSDEDNYISISGNNYNGCSYCENTQISRESDGINEKMTFANTYGVNNQAQNILGRRSDAFQAGDEISLSGIVPALNLPTYSNDNIYYYYLNGLKIEIIEQYTDNSIKVKVTFNDYELKSDKRWCGRIKLSDNTTDDLPDLIINSGVTLTIDKSGTSNRQTLTVNNNFINPTTFTCLTNSKMLMQSSSSVIADRGSVVQLESGSSLEISNGAELLIRNGSTLLIKNGANLIVNGTGKVTIVEGAYICIEQGANINLVDVQSKLDLQSGFQWGINPVLASFTNLGISGNCMDLCNLIYTGNGIISGSDMSVLGIKTWSVSEYYIYGNIVLEPGSIFTFHSSVVKFMEPGKITVKPGGKLILDNCEMTNACNNMWQGIAVWGNGSLLQTEANQGVIELLNGAVIENTKYGVLLGKKVSDWCYDYSKSGGIFRAEACTLKNNITAVKFMPYSIQNTSYFRNCHFITDEQLKNITSLTPGYFINMKVVNGIIIEGCEFINNSPAEYSYNKRGSGIYGDNSQFNVQKFNTVKCRFENLYMGIKAINCQLQVISIMDAEFYNIDKGNFLFNLKTPIIIGNSISLYQNISTDASYGMIIWNCTGYRLENNIVQGLNTASIGFYVINSGTGYNKIYHNDFTNLKYGIQVNS
ncbi:MAG: hypothetical protein HY738_02425, partial [Bacteroidia bacterium]|nr:hypothetical protein [Bacteroidia bacterium]